MYYTDPGTPVADMPLAITHHIVEPTYLGRYPLLRQPYLYDSNSEPRLSIRVELRPQKYKFPLVPLGLFSRARGFGHFLSPHAHPIVSHPVPASPAPHKSVG